MLAIAVKVVLGFLILGVLLLWIFLGFSYFVAFMLSPLYAPFVVQGAARLSELYADKVALQLGYGRYLVDGSTGREHQRASGGTSCPDRA